GACGEVAHPVPAITPGDCPGHRLGRAASTGTRPLCVTNGTSRAAPGPLPGSHRNTGQPTRPRQDTTSAPASSTTRQSTAAHSPGPGSGPSTRPAVSGNSAPRTATTAAAPTSSATAGPRRHRGASTTAPTTTARASSSPQDAVVKVWVRAGGLKSGALSTGRANASAASGDA